MRRALFAVCFLLIFLSGLVIIAMWASSRRSNQANSWLQVVATVKFDNSMDCDLANAASKMGMAVRLQNCPGNECVKTVTISNTPMYWLRLAPKTELVTEWKPTWKSEEDFAVIYRTRLSSGTTGISIFRTTDSQSEPVAIYRNLSGTVPWQAIVRVKEGASSTQRASAFDLNVDCLASLGGCQNSQEMAPKLWEAGPR